MRSRRTSYFDISKENNWMPDGEIASALIYIYYLTITITITISNQKKPVNFLFSQQLTFQLKAVYMKYDTFFSFLFLNIGKAKWETEKEKIKEKGKI